MIPVSRIMGREKASNDAFSCININATYRGKIMIIRFPRIYTYKITFEEVPYYYYGVHKEKVSVSYTHLTLPTKA